MNPKFQLVLALQETKLARTIQFDLFRSDIQNAMTKILFCMSVVTSNSFSLKSQMEISPHKFVFQKFLASWQIKFPDKTSKPEIWPQRQRYFAAAIAMHHAGVAQSVRGWHISGEWHTLGVDFGPHLVNDWQRGGIYGGGVNQRLSHGLLQYYTSRLFQRQRSEKISSHWNENHTRTN